VRGNAAFPDIAHDVANGAVMVGISDSGLAETIQLACCECVAVDSEGQTDKETDKRDEHADVPAEPVTSETGNSWEEGTTANGCNDEGASVKD